MLTRAGLQDGRVLVEAAALPMLESAEAAWAANRGSAVFAAVRALGDRKLASLRADYLASVSESDLHAPADVQFVLARRP